MSRLVIIGSGETAPTMVRVHRRILAETGDGPAVMLDTPFAFQRNADELVARTRAYFSESVGRDVEVARWRRRDAPLIERERALALLGSARWAFAGPGSPTYALRQWVGTEVPGALADVVRRGGTVVLGSAAAVTAGTYAIPVYEIYKSGEDPHWVEGLDLLGELTGLHAVVVPHYDNSEGGTHDTRFCYLGEERLALLESSLPPETGVLGVDEHTALVLDLESGTATVHGNGAVTVRRRGASRELEQGAVLPLDDLEALLRGEGTALPGPVAAPVQPRDPPAVPAASLAGAAESAREDFEAALVRGDADGCVAAVLGLEQALDAWRADTLQGGDAAAARRVLRSLVVRLGEVAAVGVRDPRDVVGRYVELVLELRSAARSVGDFAASDSLRDRLALIGVDVKDTADGALWSLRPAPA